MTLLRMLAFRPADAGQAKSSGGSGGKRAPAPPKAAPRSSKTAEVGCPAARKASAGWQDPGWTEPIPSLQLKGAVRMLAINCAYLRRDGDTLYFTADSKAEAVFTRERRDTLAKALSTYFDEALRVDIALADTIEESAETPVQAETRKTGEQYDAARESIESDPNVQALRDMFGAELKTDTIEPITPPRSD